ncbi:MAG: XdhC family protein [Acidobacteriota bacterium]
MHMIEVFEELQKREKENKASVLITITGSRGSSPGKPGFKMLVGEEGRLTGTIGGGGPEFYAIKRSKELLAEGSNFVTETLILRESTAEGGSTNLREDGKIEIPSLCGGEVTLFYEVFNPANLLYIFGAGHVGQAVARMGKLLNYNVIMIDNREDVLGEIPINCYNEKHYADFPKLASEAKAPFDLNTQGFALIVTHNHLNDMNVLHYLYRNYPGLKYIGLIGSVRKVKEAVSFVNRELGGNPDFRNLYAPVGLDLGGNSPDEIALSVLSEIQALKHGKEMKHLRLDYSKFL